MAPNEDRLIAAIRQMASFSIVDNVLPDILHRIAVLANETVEDSAFVGLTMSIDRKLQTPAFTDDEAPELDAIQYQTGIGPCIDAYRTGANVIIPSTRFDTRWKAFSEACLTHGVLSTLSVAVVCAGEPAGALSFYSYAERAFDDDDETLATAFADQAGIAIGNARAYWDVRTLSEQLTQALESRVVIEQAKGLLMSTGITSSAAFELLRTASQRRNRKLHAIAADIVSEAERRALSA